MEDRVTCVAEKTYIDNSSLNRYVVQPIFEKIVIVITVPLSLAFARTVPNAETASFIRG